MAGATKAADDYVKRWTKGLEDDDLLLKASGVRDDTRKEAQARVDIASLSPQLAYFMFYGVHASARGCHYALLVEDARYALAMEQLHGDPCHSDVGFWRKRLREMLDGMLEDGCFNELTRGIALSPAEGGVPSLQHMAFVSECRNSYGDKELFEADLHVLYARWLAHEPMALRAVQVETGKVVDRLLGPYRQFLMRTGVKIDYRPRDGKEDDAWKTLHEYLVCKGFTPSNVQAFVDIAGGDGRQFDRLKRAIYHRRSIALLKYEIAVFPQNRPALEERIRHETAQLQSKFADLIDWDCRFAVGDAASWQADQ